MQFLIAIIGILTLLIVAMTACEDEGSSPATVPAIEEKVKDLSDSLATDDGRAYMLDRPCVDVMAEYNAMNVAGHDAAVMHVSNVYNIKTSMDPYVAISDASARVAECRK